MSLCAPDDPRFPRKSQVIGPFTKDHPLGLGYEVGQFQYRIVGPGEYENEAWIEESVS